ncbi:hypothetical protein TNCV_2922961 [Trichonephila clavipes]|nr:hypothetical protein TNCV_2922961 [Trichonephila clavipes]
MRTVICVDNLGCNGRVQLVNFLRELHVIRKSVIPRQTFSDGSIKINCIPDDHPSSPKGVWLQGVLNHIHWNGQRSSGILTHP